MSYDQALRNSVVAEMTALAAVRGSVPTSVVEAAAADLGCAVSTIWRWISSSVEDRDPDAGSLLAELKPNHIDVVFAHNGDLRSAKRELDSIDPDIAEMSESTFRRRWRQVDPAVRAMATQGAEGLLANQLRMVFDASARNDIWHIDAMEVPVWTIPDGYESALVKPWLITVQDDNTRRIMSVLLTVARPSADDTVVALADAIRIRTLSDGTEVGGVPEILHSDNGAEFKNNLVTAGLRRLGITRKLSYPYRKYLNGKVERVQGVMQDELLSKLPGFTNGPRSLSRRDIFGTESAVLTEMALVEHIYDWVEEYNSTRPHSSLDGRRPNEVWASQSTPLTRVAPEALRLSFMASRRSCKVHPRGVNFAKQYYTAPELAPLVGTLVDLRYLPRDPSFVEVFVADEWVCTAYLHADLTDSQRAAIRAQNQRQYTDARAHVAAARERRLRSAQTPDSGVLITAPSVPDLGHITADPEVLLALSEEADE